MSGLGAGVILLGVVIARMTTSTTRSAEEVIAGIAIVGALVGGFVIAPRLNRWAWEADLRDHGDNSP